MTTETTVEKQTEQPGGVQRAASGQFFRPNVDVLEKQDELLLVADMPGVESNDIDIHFEDGELTIHGRVAPRTEGRRGVLLAEYGVGDFYRTFRVSEKIDASRIHAEYANGVLTLHLPKAEAHKPRKISVQAT